MNPRPDQSQALVPRSQDVAGWGMAVGGPALVLRPTTVEGIRAALAEAKKQNLRVALRGSGCSYGDASCGRGKLVVDLTRFNQILDFDATTGLIRAQSGVTLEQVWKHAIPYGYWPPVVSGTMAPTLGGAVSMNIHGKNAFAVGTLGDHVEALEILTPAGELRELSRTQEPELFHAIIGGFGELAVITRVDLHLKRVHSGLLDVHAFSAPDLDAMFRIFEEQLPGSDYLVGWIDGFAGGKSLGRGLIHAAHQLRPGVDPQPEATLQVASQELPPRLFGVLPKSWMWAMMKPFAHDLGMRLINLAKYLSGKLLEDGKQYRQSHAGFHFLLDYVPNWKWIYKPGGLIQHQSFVPHAEGPRVFRAILQLTQDRGMPSWLAVMKRHRADPFLLTHGLDGWSLALDFPVTDRNRAELWAMCHEIERLVVQAGGRFYFAKDATLEPETVAAMFPSGALARFAALRQRLDPDGLLATDLYDRAVAPALARQIVALPASEPLP
jgi:decaprenylphospho-beta-D-ribofuranose 2-oxidase